MVSQSLRKRLSTDIRLGTAYQPTILLAMNLCEMRSSITAAHQRRVAGIAEIISLEMGLSEFRAQGILVAGLLHDIGKINTPDAILDKPGPLSELEFNIMKQHPQAGYDALKSIPFPWPIAEIVYQHHERFDGTGYPQGLRADQNLLESRILAVADTLDAITSHRPYHPARSLNSALLEIEKHSGASFDPDVVIACLRLFRT